ncbi:MAG: nucleotidyltransferase family protein [Gemmatimonadaceae bacterium]
MVTKAVILARGLGTRMRRASDEAGLSDSQARIAASGMKALMPVEAGDSTARPFLDYVLSALADAGVQDVCLVIGPEHTAIREYYGQLSRARLRVAFAEQAQPRGTADALLAAESFAGSDAFLVLNSDNYYPIATYRTLCEYGGAALPGFDRHALITESNIDAARIRSFALLSVSADGWLQDIVEKPDDETFERMGPHALVSMNLWALTTPLFDACRQVQPSARGELELPNAVRLAVREMGMKIRVFPVTAGVLDLSSRGDVGPVADALRHITVRL